MPVTVDTFETRRRHISPKVTTVTRKAAQASKTMTVARMATPRGPIPLTVDTFEASGGREGWGGDTMWGGGERGAQTHIRKWKLLYYNRVYIGVTNLHKPKVNHETQTRGPQDQTRGGKSL